MDTPPGPLPEGVLIATALRQTGLSTRAAAKRAGMSDGRWHQIVKGFQTVSGQRVPVRGPAHTVARMAQVVGVTPEQLAGVDRADAAEELRALLESAPADGFDEKVTGAHAMLDEIERNPSLQERLRKILLTETGHPAEPGNSSETGDAGHNLTG